MVRNLLSLKCRRARARLFVCPALPVPEGQGMTRVTCHGHQLHTCVPSAAGRASRGGQLHPALPCVRREAALSRCLCPALDTGTLSLRLGGDLVVLPAAGEPWLDGAAPAWGPAGPQPLHVRGCSWPAVGHGATGAPHRHCWASTGDLGLAPGIRDLAPKECPELFPWDKTP